MRSEIYLTEISKALGLLVFHQGNLGKIALEEESDLASKSYMVSGKLFPSWVSLPLKKKAELDHLSCLVINN